MMRSGQVTLDLREYDGMRDTIERLRRQLNNGLEAERKAYREEIEILKKEYEERFQDLRESYKNLQKDEIIAQLNESLERLRDLVYDLQMELKEERSRPWWKNRKKK